MSPMRVTDNESIQRAMRGFCRVCVNVNDFSPDAVVETINGVATDNGRFIGGLVGEPSFASEDELIDYTENIYGAQGPFRGGWNVQSTQSSITATIMKLSVENFQLLFPDFQDGGAWDGLGADGTTTETYGQIVTRSGNVRDENYLDNALLVFEGQTDDEVGMMIRINNAINRADSKEFSPDGDGNIAGVEVQLMGHQDLGSLSDTGQPQPPVQFYIPDLATPA